MRNTACLLGTAALTAFLGATLLGSGVAQAAACEGINARTYEAPVTLHKGADGSTLMLVHSTGTSIRNGATAMQPVWQTCFGFWTANADKSGSGYGHCYSVDGDGDQWTISWEGSTKDKGGTWQAVGGTGKYADDRASKGTWGYGKKLADGTSITTWKGDCAK